jgi:calmodulin-regulated spectrin-associated protein
LPFFPLLEDLMRDVCDGAALLTVVHYYCPNLMKLDGRTWTPSHSTNFG